MTVIVPGSYQKANAVQQFLIRRVPTIFPFRSSRYGCSWTGVLTYQTPEHGQCRVYYAKWEELEKTIKQRF